MFSLLGGNWIDITGGKNIFTIYLLPIAAGLVCITLIPGIAAAAIFLFLTGVSVGLSGPVRSATIAELYETGKLGAI